MIIIIKVYGVYVNTSGYHETLSFLVFLNFKLQNETKRCIMDYLENVSEEEIEHEEEEEKSCPCGYFCDDCLGLSWNDFI